MKFNTGARFGLNITQMKEPQIGSGVMVKEGGLIYMENKNISVNTYSYLEFSIKGNTELEHSVCCQFIGWLDS